MSDITKLPKWAQNEITRLRANEDYWKALALAGPDDSNTFIRTAEESKPLGASPYIEFVHGPTWGEKFSVYLDDKELRISSSEGLAVLPQASNVVRIKSWRH